MDSADITGTAAGGSPLSKRASAVYLSSSPDSSIHSSSLTRIRMSSALSNSSTPLASPTPSRTPSPRPPSPRPPPRVDPTPKPYNSLAESPLSRRLSRPVIYFAIAAARPSTYIDLVRSLHPPLLAFFLASVSSTISNKALLKGFFGGIYFFLTAWQMACATLGTMLGARLGAYRPIKLSPKREGVLKMVALVFSLEILASNLALRFVIVPFHVSVRAASPLLSLALSVTFFHSHTTLRTASSLLLVLLGISLTAHREAWISLGSLLLVISTVLLSAKSLLVTHLLSARFHLHPLDVLARMSPLAMIHCTLFAVLNGEVTALWHFVRSDDFTRTHLLEIALNGVLSFAVVVLGLVAERRTKPPALAITSHAAQATTILVSLLVFGLTLTVLNFLGVGLVLAGGVLYAHNEAKDDEERDPGVGGAGGMGEEEEELPTKMKREDEERSGGMTWRWSEQKRESHGGQG
ncbi:hypothetical protein JCM21900_005406 [Sporobolomyces salmonicolor]